MKIILYFIGLLASIATSVGLVFKLLHWPGADELIIYGFIAFTILFAPMATGTKLSILQGAEKLRAILGVSSAGISGTAVIFKLLHLQGADILLLSGAALFSFGFLPFLFFSLYKKSTA